MTEETARASAHDDSTVTLRIPAQRRYVTAIRALARSAATLCELTVDDIEDLQMAVDEAATLLLPLVDAGNDGHLSATFVVQADGLLVSVSAQRATGSLPDRSGLAWIMLSALAEDLDVVDDSSTVGIRFSRRRQVISS